MTAARIAYVSPMPPAPTGVAGYSRAVLAGLRASGFARRHRLDVLWPLPEHAPAAVAAADLAVYHIGNNLRFHGAIYGLAVRRPGLVVLHDLALDDLARGLLDTGDPFGTRTRDEALATEVGEDVPEGPLRTPWCAYIVRRARGVIVHSDFGRRYLDAIGCRTPVFVVPHAPIPGAGGGSRVARMARRLRRRLGGGPVVGVLGDIGSAKGIEAVVEAARSLDPRPTVAIVGRRIPGYAVEDALGPGDRVVVAPDVSDREFLVWVHASDVVVNLRHPHRGEVSGTLIRAMQAGTPAVVSAVGTYLDLPEGSVVRVPAGPSRPEDLAAALAPLLEDPVRRRAVGERARAHVRGLEEERATARGYEAAIAETLALLRDPVRGALSRWAGAVADTGGSAETLRRGMGRSYLDALEELGFGSTTPEP